MARSYSKEILVDTLCNEFKMEVVLITEALVSYQRGDVEVALCGSKELQLSCQGVPGIAAEITQYQGIITYRLVFTRTSANIENKAGANLLNLEQILKGDKSE